jgi:hypothetical protein
MAATILIALDDYTMGVPADEASINVNRVTIKRAGEKIEVRKRAGGWVGRVDHSFKWTVTLNGEFNADFAAYVGKIISIATCTWFGINTGGSFIVDDFDFANENTALMKLTVNATGYDVDDIPATAVQVPATATSPPILIP